jgi:GntR family transcriptional regulator
MGTRLPKAYTVKEALLELVKDLPAGSPVEPERSLAARFGVSRETVRQAIQELVFEGRLRRLQGRGTFVAPPKLTQPLQLSSYTSDINASGMRPSSTLLRAATIPASGEVAGGLALPDGHPVYELERLRLADGEPMALETLYLDAERFAGIDARLTATASVYQLLREGYGVDLAGGTAAIECVLASPHHADLLACEPRAPLLCLTQRSWGPDGIPVELVRSVYRGDRYRFATELAPPAANPLSGGGA